MAKKEKNFGIYIKFITLLSILSNPLYTWLIPDMALHGAVIVVLVWVCDIFACACLVLHSRRRTDKEVAAIAVQVKVALVAILSLEGADLLISIPSSSFLNDFVAIFDELNMITMFFTFYHFLLVKSMIKDESRRYYYHILTTLFQGLHLSAFIILRMTFSNALSTLVQISFVVIALVTACGFTNLESKLSSLSTEMLLLD